MTIEQIIEALGDKFDEVRRSPMDGTFMAYLIDGRRRYGKDIREALENLLEDYEPKATLV